MRGRGTDGLASSDEQGNELEGPRLGAPDCTLQSEPAGDSEWPTGKALPLSPKLRIRMSDLEGDPSSSLVNPSPGKKEMSTSMPNGPSSQRSPDRGDFRPGGPPRPGPSSVPPRYMYLQERVLVE